MPSIPYTEEPRSDNSQPEAPHDADSSCAMLLYNPYKPSQSEDAGVEKNPGNQGPRGNGDFDQEYLKLRRWVLAAQIMALVSLVIGGVLLSSISLVFAIMSYRRASIRLGSSGQADALGQWSALQRSAKIAIAMSAGALALNAISLIVLYPMVVDMLQSGEYTELFSGSNAASSGSSRGSIWG